MLQGSRIVLLPAAHLTLGTKIILTTEIISGIFAAFRRICRTGP
jgi:hypothetical protein